MIKEAIIKLSKKQNLTYTEAEEVMNEIMEGKASDVQKSAYLTALSMKGETIDEITASAAGMRAHCIKLLHDMDVLEIVGTGGDGANSFNISTTSSLVIAAAGIPVAKHGNRQILKPMLYQKLGKGIEQGTIGFLDAKVHPYRHPQGVDSIP